MTTEDQINGLTGSFVDDPVLLSTNKLEEMANAWMFVEKKSLVVDSIIDNKLGLDGDGKCNGTGVVCVGGCGL